MCTGGAWPSLQCVPGACPAGLDTGCGSGWQGAGGPLALRARIHCTPACLGHRWPGDFSRASGLPTTCQGPPKNASPGTWGRWRPCRCPQRKGHPGAPAGRALGGSGLQGCSCRKRRHALPALLLALLPLTSPHTSDHPTISRTKVPCPECLPARSCALADGATLVELQRPDSLSLPLTGTHTSSHGKPCPSGCVTADPALPRGAPTPPTRQTHVDSVQDVGLPSGGSHTAPTAALIQHGQVSSSLGELV